MVTDEPKDVMKAIERAKKLALALADAEAEYRRSYQLYGPSDIRTGQAWDKMRRRGDATRATFAAREEAPDTGLTKEDYEAIYGWGGQG